MKTRPHSADTVLVPCIRTIDSDLIDYPNHESDSEQLKILQNEFHSAETYPVKLSNSSYFSEVVGGDFPDVLRYRTWVDSCVKVIIEAVKSEAVVYGDINQLGKELQKIDVAFAAEQIVQGPDPIHLLCGPSIERPYRKMTLARTIFPAKIGLEIIPFFYEKYLVCYSCLDALGQRMATVTPIHSHPLNHEVTYFLSFGVGASVVEEEFRLDGSTQRLVLESEKRRPASYRPTILPPFASEIALRENQDVFASDGKFRPHRVTVHDGLSISTLYYAVNNYWGPRCEVKVYSEEDIARQNS